MPPLWLPRFTTHSYQNQRQLQMLNLGAFSTENSGEKCFLVYELWCSPIFKNKIASVAQSNWYRLHNEVYWVGFWCCCLWGFLFWWEALAMAARLVTCASTCERLCLSPRAMGSGAIETVYSTWLMFSWFVLVRWNRHVPRFLGDRRGDLAFDEIARVRGRHNGPSTVARLSSVEGYRKVSKIEVEEVHGLLQKLLEQIYVPSSLIKKTCGKSQHSCKE